MINVTRLYCGIAGASDALRYGPGGKGRSARREFAAARRPVVVWNCTRRCNLRCVHCYSGSTAEAGADELTTDQGLVLLEDLAAFGCPVVLLSGGEPLLRPDLFHLAERAARLGLRATLSTNGTLIDERTAERLRQINLGYVGVSLDGMRRTNDRFRGLRGAFDLALAGIRRCLKAGVKAGLRFTLNRRNIGDLPDIFNLVRDEGIPRVCFYHLVYAGRGAALLADDLDHDQGRRAVDLILDRTAELAAKGTPREVLTVDNHCDGPYLYLRMLREGSTRAEEVLDLLRVNGGNASGSGIGCVSWDGAVHPDQFWRHLTLGNVRERKFSEIWTDASHPILARLRDRRRHLKGRCAACRFLDVCGGNFRVRAEARTGDLWAPDPACYLTDEEIAGPESPDVREEVGRG